MKCSPDKTFISGRCITKCKYFSQCRKKQLFDNRFKKINEKGFNNLFLIIYGQIIRKAREARLGKH